MENEKVYYPRVIVGDPSVDDFGDSNPAVKLTRDYRELVEEVGKEMASKIFWSFYILIDPTSFYYTRSTYTDRLAFILANYLTDFDPMKYDYVEKFYNEFILKDIEILQYNEIRKRFEQRLKTDSKLSVVAAAKDREALRELEKIVFNKVETAVRVVIQGQKQPGIMASTTIKNFSEQFLTHVKSKNTEN